MMSKPRVVIVGGGFGGLNVARGLKDAPVDVILIDKTNHHLFQPLLYEVANAALTPSDIAMPFRQILRRQKNAFVILGGVKAFDTVARQLLMVDGERISYHNLVLAVGAKHSYFGNDAWEKFAPGLKTLHDALRIRERTLMSFEKAERSHLLEERERWLRFVIIGGGPTGVENAGAIAEIAHQTMLHNFRRIDPKSSKIILVEASSRVLPTFPEELSEKAKQTLEKMGVTVLTGRKVENVDARGVDVDGEWIETPNVIWAAGNRASPLLTTLDVPLDRQGRVVVEPDLSIPGHPEVFVIGDAACVIGKDGKPLPGLAQPAIQEGRYVAKIIRYGIPKEKRPPFVYFDLGIMAAIGKSKAVVAAGPLRLNGFLAWLMWCFVHIFYLIGFRNRILVMLEWCFWYLTKQRGSRLITRPEMNGK